MSASASIRQITRITRHLLASSSPRSTPSTSSTPFTLTHHHHYHRRQLTISTISRNKNNNRAIDQPPTRINSLNLNLEAPADVPQSEESIKSIDQVMREIQREAQLKAAQANAQYSNLSEPPVPSASTSGTSGAGAPEYEPHQQQQSSDNPYSNTNTQDSSSASSSETQQPRPQKKPSRFWIYMYHILYWSAIGSIPVHLLMTKGEAKDLKERQEWKIAVLTDMRDKLRRGESVEEEEALLTVGHDRSKREEQVDEKYFEDLLQSAEKMDFIFSKEKEAALAIPAPTEPAAPAPAAPVVPRKPAPPKSEKSYL
ncbi:hypothetical protein BGX33_009862 [Mortierella sp. NVP41]|nr:hypothetical protein BGX33_009862 [Mortierella sp. NVP41]